MREGTIYFRTGSYLVKLVHLLSRPITFHTFLYDSAPWNEASSKHLLLSATNCLAQYTTTVMTTTTLTSQRRPTTTPTLPTAPSSAKSATKVTRGWATSEATSSTSTVPSLSSASCAPTWPRGKARWRNISKLFTKIRKIFCATFAARRLEWDQVWFCQINYFCCSWLLC